MRRHKYHTDNFSIYKITFNKNMKLKNKQIIIKKMKYKQIMIKKMNF